MGQVSQGNAATYIRGGGSFNSSFLPRSFLNLAVKKYENGSTVAQVIVKIKGFLFETRGRKKPDFITLRRAR